MRIAVFVVAVVAATLAGGKNDRRAEQRLAGPAGNRGEIVRRGSDAVGDEKAIRQVVDAFVKNYNNHDADGHCRTVCLGWDGGGRGRKRCPRSRGHRAGLCPVIFGKHPKTRIENVIESIRPVGPAEAVEDGTTTIIHDRETPAEKSRYRVIHVKRDGKWQMALGHRLAGRCLGWRNHAQTA